MADILAADHPSITFELLPSSRHRLWYALGDRRSRGARLLALPRSPLGLTRRSFGAARPIRRPPSPLPWRECRCWDRVRACAVLRRLFRAIDRVLPPPDEVADVFRRIKPDVLLLTPLLYFRSHQVDHVRCARQLGIKSVLGVGSWDHLTTKGLIHEVPDRVLVWNEAQKQEAIELHGVPAERVLVTGAQAYDHWFATKPSLDRDGFCRQVGLDPARPILLYLCSSPFIAPLRSGIRASSGSPRSGRSADPRLRDCGRARAAASAELRSSGRASTWPPSSTTSAFWPKTGVNPIGGAARSRLLRLDVPRRSRGRREHERHDRVGHRRPAGLHD